VYRHGGAAPGRLRCATGAPVAVDAGRGLEESCCSRNPLMTLSWWFEETMARVRCLGHAVALIPLGLFRCAVVSMSA